MDDAPRVTSVHTKDAVWLWLIRVAVAISVVWVVVGITIASLWQTPLWQLPLNEVGDFFAGFAGPPAFLWLVLGFFQQGRELRIQAEELRQSVEQFKIQSAHMGQDVQHAALLERKNQVRRLFDLRSKRLSFVLEPLYRKPLLGDERSPGTIRLFDTKPGFITSVGAPGDLKKDIDHEIARLSGLEAQHEDIWSKLFAAQESELLDFPDRAFSFGQYVSKLEHEAHQCGLSDIMFELERDRIKVLGRILLRIAKHSKTSRIPAERISETSTGLAD